MARKVLPSSSANIGALVSEVEERDISKHKGNLHGCVETFFEALGAVATAVTAFLTIVTTVSSLAQESSLARGVASLVLVNLAKFLIPSGGSNGD